MAFASRKARDQILAPLKRDPASSGYSDSGFCAVVDGRLWYKKVEIEKGPFFCTPKKIFIFFDYQKKSFSGCKKKAIFDTYKKVEMEKGPFFFTLKKIFIFFKIPN